MARRRDHYPRFDGSMCPDAQACIRLYHHVLMAGDTCECCGYTIPDDGWE